MGIRFILVAITLALFPMAALAQVTTSGAELASISSSGQIPNDSSAQPVAPPNGDFVVFQSLATDLTNNPTSGNSHIFEYSGSSRVVSPVSVVASTDAFPTTAGSQNPAVSAVLPSGNYAIVFESNATDLVPGFATVTPTPTPLATATSPSGLAIHASNASYDNSPPPVEQVVGATKQIYIRIPTTNETLLVSDGNNCSPGVQCGANDDCKNPYVVALPNPDRFLVAFTSKATNLVATPPGVSTVAGVEILYVATFNRVGEQFQRTSIDRPFLLPTGGPINGDMNYPAISGNGRYVAFSSAAAFAPVANGKEQIYLVERATKGITLVSRNPSTKAIGNDDSGRPSISFLGDNVAFLSKATNLVPGTSTSFKALVYNFPNKTLKQVNTSSSGTPSTGTAYAVEVNSDGRLVAFSDDDGGLVGTPSSAIQTYLRNMRTGEVVRTSITSDGTPANRSSGGSAVIDSLNKITLGAPQFNSRTYVTSFASVSNNLFSPDATTTRAKVFRSAVTLPLPRFVSNGKIESPPDVTVEEIPGKTGAKVTIVLLEFDAGTSSASQAEELVARASRSSRVTYRLEIRKQASKKRIYRGLSRNTTTINRLSPGRYSIRYRAVKTSGSKKTKTQYSPSRSIEVD